MALLVDYSWFSVHKLEAIADWELLLAACGWDNVERASQFHALLTFNRPIWAIVEKDYVEKDYRSIYAHHYSKVFASYPRTIFRVHFWETEVVGPAYALDVEKNAAHYMGFCCLFNNQMPLIGRTVLDSNKVAPSSRIIQTKFEVNLFGSRLYPRGFPFIQQDTNVMVCAQASVWMVLRYFSEKYSYYRDVFPHEIALAPTIHPHGRAIPSSGLHAWEICDVISRFGFHPENNDRGAFNSVKQSDQFLELLHRYLESGIPVILGSVSKGHAVVAVGVGPKLIAHRGSPVSRDGVTYIPAWRYYDSVIANNDNLLPYSVVPETGGHISLSDVDSLIVPLYEKIYLSGRDAENVGLGILAHPQLGIQAYGAQFGFTDKFLNDTLVIRTVLTSSRSFKEYHQQTGDTKQSSSLYRLEPMPKFIWLVEISNDGLFRQGQKFAEIVLDATSSKYARSPFLFIRYPELLIHKPGASGPMIRNLGGENPTEPLYENLK